MESTNIKTKIICTIGPETESFEMIQRMAGAGMNIVRLNMSHGDHDWHQRVIKHVKTLNRKVKFPIAIMLDTQGPEIRTGHLSSDLDLKKGSVISIMIRGASEAEETSIHIDYDDLISTVHAGEKITVDNGLINLEVLEKHERMMRCRVLDGGILKSKSHVNLPGVRINLPAITQKDRRDILFGIKHDVDYIALSFVREAADILQLKDLLGDKVGKIKIVAKIEDQEGVANVEEIISEVDGIMVARGDLGIEIPIHSVPGVQRNIVRSCAEQGKRVIVATHLLESMIKNPIPTRAEVTDVANAIYEEVDAVMLSGETTVGKYPLRCIDQLVNIAGDVERHPGLRFVNKLNTDNDKQKFSLAAVELAESLGARCIVVITRRGITADMVCNCRPVNSDIYAFTNVSQARRTMMMGRGIRPFRIAFSQDPEKTLQTAFKVLKDREGFKSDEKVVVISDVLAGSGKIDAIQIRHLP
ncbi:MAG: Pyruvate kinase [Deltaproteobacteria bacterium]|jgi:pyruvate kinase|nr:Pyruvate kinase [Deltaproteobacteria bacterium]